MDELSSASGHDYASDRSAIGLAAPMRLAAKAILRCWDFVDFMEVDLKRGNLYRPQRYIIHSWTLSISNMKMINCLAVMYEFHYYVT